MQILRFYLVGQMCSCKTVLIFFKQIPVINSISVNQSQLPSSSGNQLQFLHQYNVSFRKGKRAVEILKVIFLFLSYIFSRYYNDQLLVCFEHQQSAMDSLEREEGSYHVYRISHHPLCKLCNPRSVQCLWGSVSIGCFVVACAPV